MNISLVKMKAIIGDYVCQLSVLIDEKEKLTKAYDELNKKYEELVKKPTDVEKT
jgi:hypothetical protein